MYLEKRPTCVTVIGWVWIILGGLMCFSSIMALIAIFAIGQMAQSHTDAPKHFMIILKCMPLLAIGQAGMGVLGIVSGINFFKLKSWSRKVLEVLSWILLAYVIGFGIFWLASWTSLTTGRDDAAFGIMGTFVGIFMLALYGIPLGIMLKYLRGSRVRDAINKAESFTLESMVSPSNRTALMETSLTDRVTCKSPGCENTILPTTAEKTGGYCMPCVQAKVHREREEFIRNNRKDVNPYEGMDDPVEIIKVFHHPRKPDPLIRYLPCPREAEDLYSELKANQAIALIKHAMALFSSGDVNQAEDIARCMTAFTYADLSPLLRTFISADHFYPGFVFLRANPDIRDMLLERIARVPEGHDHLLIRNHLLVALAWIGDERVVDLFGKWHISPPSWAKTLHVPPEGYAQEAGWQLSSDLHRRDLYYKTCYPLTRTGAGDTNSPAFAVTARQDHCPWCNRLLSNLLELDRSAEQLAFLNYSSNRISVPFCDACGCYGVLYGKLSEQGSTWSTHNAKPECLPDDGASWEGLPQRKLALAGAARSPWRAADQFLPTTFSQIGGHPGWVQDAEYPHCPECQQSMVFIGQVVCNEVLDPSEGIHYAFLCSPCGTTATCYQQT
jgi:hypothetical protein